MSAERDLEKKVDLQKLDQEILKEHPDLKKIDATSRKGFINAVITQTSHKGPLPHPDTLREYNDIIPGAAERIFNEFEEQGKHRRKQENRVIGGQVTQSYIGQFLAFFIAISFLATAAYVIMHGYEFGGAMLGIADLASLVYVFYKGKYYQKENLKEKK